MPPDEDTQIAKVSTDASGNVQIDVPDTFDESKPYKIMLNGKIIGSVGMVTKPGKVVIKEPAKDTKLTAAGTAKAEVYDSFDKLLPAEKVKWTTGDTKILTINEETGAYTPVTSGAVTITAASISDPTKTGTVPVTVEKQGG